MNIFDNYLSKICEIITDNKKLLKLISLDNLVNINLEVPPDHLDYDLSSNVSLVLAKTNKLNPMNLAFEIKDLFGNLIGVIISLIIFNSFNFWRKKYGLF